MDFLFSLDQPLIFLVRLRKIAHFLLNLFELAPSGYAPPSSIKEKQTQNTKESIPVAPRDKGNKAREGFFVRLHPYPKDPFPKEFEMRVLSLNFCLRFSKSNFNDSLIMRWSNLQCQGEGGGNR